MDFSKTLATLNDITKTVKAQFGLHFYFSAGFFVTDKVMTSPICLNVEFYSPSLVVVTFEKLI